MGLTCFQINMKVQARPLLLIGCLFVILTRVSTSRLATHTRAVVRQHYGILFRPTQTFEMVTGHWLHTFGFSLPSRPTTHRTRTLNCSTIRTYPNTTHCSQAKPFVEALGRVQSHMSNMLLDMLINIERLVPVRRPQPTRTRHTRSWLPFIGNVLKTVGGTATQDDIARLTKSIDALRRSTATAYNQWATSEGEIASMIHMSNARMATFERMLDAQRHTVEAQYRQISQSVADIGSMTALLPNSD